MPGLFDAPFGFGGFNEQMLNDPTPVWFAAHFAKQKLKPQEDAVYAAFGRFIAAYSLAEAAFFVVVRHFSGLPDIKSRPIFAGMKPIDLIPRIRGLISEENDLNSFNRNVAQFNLITNERNQLIHREITFDALGNLVITNELSSKLTNSMTPRILSKDILGYMESDCKKIFGNLIILCDRTEELKHVPDVSLLSLGFSWKYTPPPPDTPNQRGP